LTHRSLALAPLLLAVLFAALAALAPASARDAVIQGEVDVGKTLAFLGMLAAAMAFDRGDYLRRGWGVWAGTYLFLLGRDAMLLLHGAVSPLLYEGVRGALVTLGNACVVVGAWTLARAWSVSGLEHPGSVWSRRAVVAVAVLLALVFAGPGLVVDVRDLFDGDGSSVGALASDLGDILSLPLIAPVALTALAVREGTLRWTWMLLTASLVAWLFYDAVYVIPDFVDLHSDAIRIVGEQFHVLAATFACAAGLAQRKAVTDDEPDVESR
jgi:hypothetical protein